MGMIHQDCLTSWLEVTRGDGRCEICKTKFRFDPQYAENTPDRLPAHEVVLGLSSRLIARWLPLAARICVAVTLWLIVAPLLTNFLYHGWMIRPSSVLSRWKRELILADIVSGAVMTAIIIISFLSLMSFADFLRAHWQQQQQQHQPRDRQQEQVRDQQGNRIPVPDIIANLENGADPVAVLENALEDMIDGATTVQEAIDNGVLDFLESRQQTESTVALTERDSDGNDGPRDDPTEDSSDSRHSSTVARCADQARQIREAVLEQEADRQSTEPGQDPVHIVDEETNDPADPVEDDELDEVEDGWPEEFPDDEADDVGNGVENAGQVENALREGDGQGPRNFDPIDPMLQDDQVVSTSFNFNPIGWIALDS